MTTRVPDGTPQEAVDEVRSREAVRARQLSVETTPLTAHPNDPAGDKR
jgi:muconolactone delta-isomerase